MSYCGPLFVNGEWSLLIISYINGSALNVSKAFHVIAFSTSTTWHYICLSSKTYSDEVSIRNPWQTRIQYVVKSMLKWTNNWSIVTIHSSLQLLLPDLHYSCSTRFSFCLIITFVPGRCVTLRQQHRNWSFHWTSGDWCCFRGRSRSLRDHGINILYAMVRQYFQLNFTT